MPIYGRRKMRMVAVKPTTPRKGKYTGTRKRYSKAVKTTFTAKVQKIIASNVENKYTASVSYKADVGQLRRHANLNSNPPIYTDTCTWFVWAPGNGVNGMFNIPQGASQQARIGNRIKLKRWIIKGMIQPNPAFPDTPANPQVNNSVGISPNAYCGYVDVYFGRRMDNLTPVGNDIAKFYQNGSTDITPLGRLQETLYPINKDLYKVYFRRRFKVGTGSGFSGGGSTLVYDPAPTASGANGFGLTKSFGFDVCKYIAKNKLIVYDESDTTPQYDNIENLCIWATFHPAAGDLAAVNPTIDNQATLNNTFYQINAMSYAEYEDA